MSSSSGVQPCPEPLPFSNDLYSAAEVNYSPSSQPAVNSTVSDAQFVFVDSLLSNQLGPITNPVTNNQQPQYNSSPVLPVVGDNNAVPVLSSNNGADVNNSYTLLQNESVNTPNNFMSLSPSIQQNFQPQPMQPQPMQPQPLPPQPMQPQPMQPQPMPPVAPIQTNEVSNKLTPSESFNNVNKKPDNNISKFIQNNKPIAKKEHFNGKKIEHFKITTGSSTLDIVCLFAILGVIIYMVFPELFQSGSFNDRLSSIKIKLGNINHEVENMVSHIPVLSQLVDDKVSDTHKLILVAAIVIGVIFLLQMLK
jgi:hypothetical protein